jgi:hypothetical protein
MNEENLNEENSNLAEGYFKKYRKQVESFEKGLVSKAVGTQPHHIVQLGKQLDQWNEYKGMHEANGSLNNLGDLPRVAMDVISATMGNSILPVISSTQAIENQKGIIYFKNIRAESTKGNLSQGEKVVDPRTGVKTPKGYASNKVEQLQVGAGDGAASSMSAALNQPIRREFLKITTEDANIFGEDVGPRGADQNVGTILGAGVSGTINYATGALALTFAAPLANGVKVFASFQVNLEDAADIPRMTSFLDSTIIEAHAYALKSVVGMFQQFALKKQFGDSYLDDLVVDLTKEINAELGGDMISKYSQSFASGGGSATTFSKALPSGAAYTEKMYRENYALRLGEVETKMIESSGRGTVKVMIVGRNHAAFVRNLEGFNVLSDGATLGCHIFGTYKGIVYVRVPEEQLLGSDEGIALYSGASALESAGVYAPFMPLTIVNKPAGGANPLLDQTVGATMAGLKVVVPAFIQKLDLVA